MIETFQKTTLDIALVFLGFGPSVDQVKDATLHCTKIFFHDAELVKNPAA